MEATIYFPGEMCTITFSQNFQLRSTKGDRGMSDGFSALSSTESKGWFPRYSSRRVSIGTVHNASIAPLVGTSVSHLTGVAPVGSYSCKSERVLLGMFAI